MGSILTPNEFIWESIDRLISIASNRFRSSVRPIYGSSKTEIPVHIGSSILLTVDGRDYLLTAAHIIDENEFTTLYVGGADGLIQIDGNFLCTQKPGGNRLDDHYDIAWQALSDRFVEELADVEFVADSQISPNLSHTAGRLFMAYGYPNSKNKRIDTLSQSVSPKLFQYSSTTREAKEVCKELDLSGESHLFLDFDSNYSRSYGGTKVSSIKPKGISGGMLIDLADAANPETYDPKTNASVFLAGMLIENLRPHKVMSSVRMDVIIDLIRGSES